MTTRNMDKNVRLERRETVEPNLWIFRVRVSTPRVLSFSSRLDLSYSMSTFLFFLFYHSTAMCSKTAEYRVDD
jgi:hypothetical protein